MTECDTAVSQPSKFLGNTLVNITTSHLSCHSDANPLEQNDYENSSLRMIVFWILDGFCTLHISGTGGHFKEVCMKLLALLR